MKKLLLLSAMILGSFSMNAQYSCETPTVITTDGVYTVPAISGTYITNCYSASNLDDAGNPMNTNWYQYTATASGDVTITTVLPQNASPFSDDTRVQIFTGTCAALECYDGNDDVSDTDFRSLLTFKVVSGTTYYIAWDNFWLSAGFDFDLMFNSCASPSTINAPTNITTNSATLNWDVAEGSPFQYEVEYGEVGFVQGSGAYKTVFSNTANLTGLVPSGNYDYYVRSLCGGDSKSVWNGPYGLTLLKTVPYATGFDDDNELSGITVEGGWQTTFGLDDATGNAQSPLNYIIFNTTTTAAVNNWIYTPAVSLTAGQVINTSFYVYTFSLTDNRSLKITMGSAPDMTTQTTTIYSNTALNGANLADYTLITSPNFTVPTTGIYYFGINDFTPASSTLKSMLFDTFSINTGVLSVNDFVSNQFNVFPNPAKNIISISNSTNALVSGVTITDLNGRIVKSENFTNISNITVNVSDLAAGIYMMNISSDKGIATKKIIKN